MQATETKTEVVEVIKFSVFGTHAGLDKNPQPKIRLTTKQSWTPRALDYSKWKSHVASRYLDKKYPDNKIPNDVALSKKPIIMDKTQKAFMHLHIVWASEAHGDPENVFGSIADALFLSDKHLAGSFDFEHSKNKRSRVDITIQIYGLGTA